MVNPRLQRIIRAFMYREAVRGTYANTKTDGLNLYLHGSRIGMWDAEEGRWRMRICTAGYDTSTTRKRLNLLSGVSVYHRKGQLMLALNGGMGQEWDGTWTVVPGYGDAIPEAARKAGASFGEALQVAQSRAGKE